MAGLRLSNNNFSGVFQTPAPQYGSASSYASGAGTAAFSVVGTPTTPTSQQLLHPSMPFGMATWVGIAAIAGLVFIRYSLPN